MRTVEIMVTQEYPGPKKFKTQKCAGKVLASIFWDKDGIILEDYLETGKTMMGPHYSSLLGEI